MLIMVNNNWPHDIAINRGPWLKINEEKIKGFKLPMRSLKSKRTERLIRVLGKIKSMVNMRSNDKSCCNYAEIIISQLQ